MAKKVTKFPAELLVTREVEGGNVYYVANDGLGEVSFDANEVATYRLVSVANLKVTRELV